MENDTGYIMSLANEGKYDEARKAVEALDISAGRKATLNMQIWQMQRKAESAGYDPGSHRPRYHAVWKYSYNGAVYIHKDMASYKSPVFGEKITLRIDPADPQNTFRGKAPVNSAVCIAAGLWVAVQALKPLIEILPH